MTEDEHDDLHASRYRAIMDAISVLRAETNRGFDGVYDRQDKTNGRVQSLEVSHGRHDERIESLENIEQARHQATSQAMYAAKLQPERRHDDPIDAKPITRREVTILAWAVSAAIAGTLGVLKFFGRLLP
jgi:uncharacterized protein YdcH (DUF465 family)